MIILATMDLLLVNASIIAAYAIRFGGAIPNFNFQAYRSIVVPASALFVLCFYAYELYDSKRGFSSWETASRVIAAVSVGIVLMVSTAFVLRSFSLPISVVFFSWLITVASLIVWRIAVLLALPPTLKKKRVLVVGSGEQLIKTISSLVRNQKDTVVGYLSNQKETVQTPAGTVEYLGEIDGVAEIIKSRSINHVIITSPSRYRELLEKVAVLDAHSTITIDVIPEIYEILVGRLDHTLLSDIPLVKLTREPVSSSVYATKRLADILLSLAILVLFLPLFLAIAIIIKATSPGPVFYSQKRIGKNKKIFPIYKFRTMYEGAEHVSGPVKATHGDLRITRVGRFLRRWRLDELPQIINILKGDMSFVGPRPERPHFTEIYEGEIKGYNIRHMVKPGITGLAQISGYYSSTAETKLKYDLIYICHQSTFLDFKILLQTLRVVLEGSGLR